MTGSRPYALGHVTSRDGSNISYRQLGSGPPLLLLHGGMQAAQSLVGLAGALSDAFTVYVPDRRGRGRSSAHGPGYGMARECEDVEALVRKSGARRVFGLSSGGLIALHAALAQPAIEKVAVFEPPVSVQGSVPTQWLAEFDRHVTAGRLPDALITALRGLQLSPLMARVPRALLAPMLRLAMASDDRRAHRDDTPLRALIPTEHFDVTLIQEAERETTRFDGVAADTLLLGGGKSPDFLRNALARLAAAVPRARRVELRGLDHLGPDDQGSPMQVAKVLRPFFLDAPG